MLLAGVIGYFTGGYSWMRPPIPVLLPVLTKYLTTLLFLSGLGLAIHGYYLQRKALMRQGSA